MFYVMDYAEGRVFWDPALPELTKDERGAVYDEMNRGLAAMHGGESSPWGCLISVAPRGISSGNFRFGPNSSAPVRLMSLSRWTDWPKGWAMQRAMRRDWHLRGQAGLEIATLGYLLRRPMLLPIAPAEGWTRYSIGNSPRSLRFSDLPRLSGRQKVCVGRQCRQPGRPKGRRHGAAIGRIGCTADRLSEVERRNDFGVGEQRGHVVRGAV